MARYYRSIVTTGLMLSSIFFYMATVEYPGGSDWDVSSVGFDWQRNYITHLFRPLAVNGAVNGAVPWAVAAMGLFCLCFILFFGDMAQKIPNKTSAFIIRTAGFFSMGFAFLAVTPLHDVMVLISNVLVLLTLFYVTVHLFKSRWYGFGLLSAICLATIYLGSFMYYGRQWIEWLPVVQKFIFVIAIVLVLGLAWTKEKSKLA